MKPKLINCIDCGIQKISCSKAIRCCKCSTSFRLAPSKENDIELLGSMYTNVKDAGINENGKQCYSFTHSCGISQTWIMNNLKTRLKKSPNKIPCSKCGSVNRIKTAMQMYLQKYTKDYDLKEFKGYSKKVRTLTEITYRENIRILNPLNLKRTRGNTGYHLDHIVPVIVCFTSDVSPEQASSLQNLQMLDAGMNLSKGRKFFNEQLLNFLKTLKNHDTIPKK